ncbi:MAG: hypothetical protein IPK69_03940 [Phycisphaerales bacterium]|nr:MAG: hypothetical protein IPK69_03940 [Phycisphaerales bacterium]
MPVRLHRLSLAFAAAIITSCTTLARPQPADQPAPEPKSDAPDETKAATTLTPEQVLASLQAAYRAGPTAERVNLKLMRPNQPDRLTSILVRLDPGTPDTIDPSLARAPSIRLELERIQVWMDTTSLRAISRLSARHGYEHARSSRVDAAAVREAMPPVPIPQINWALADGTHAGDDAILPPFALHAAWTASEPADRNQIALIGTTPAPSNGIIQLRLVVDTRTWRARALSLSWPDARTLELSIIPMPITDPSTWGIDLSGRTRVESLAALERTRAEIEPGDPFPAITIFTPDLAAWNITQALAALTGSTPDSGPTHACLVLFRTDQPTRAREIHQDATAAVEGAMGVIDQMWDASKGPKPTLVVRAVGVMGLDPFDPEKLHADSMKWWDGLPAADRRDEQIPLWSTAGWRAIERLDASSNVTTVVINAQNKIVGVLPSDGWTSGPARWYASLRDILASGQGTMPPSP